MKSVILAMFLMANPPTTAQEEAQARKSAFLKVANQMQGDLPSGFSCRTSFHDDAEMAYWECEFAPTGKRLGSLWLWRDGVWGKIPGLFSN